MVPGAPTTAAAGRGDANAFGRARFADRRGVGEALRMRSPILVLLVIASTGCHKQDPSRGAAVAPGARRAPAAAPEGGDPTIGPGGAASEWPKSVEVAMVTAQQPVSRTLNIDTVLPRFRTKPGAIAGELNTRFARFAKVDPEMKTHVGTYFTHCEPDLVSRFAVIMDCDEMHDYRTLAEHQAATGGSPAGPEPRLAAVWLQPGLPAIEIGQLAPGIDAAGVVARALQSAPADCGLDRCEYNPARA